MTCHNCIEQICQNKCDPKQVTTVQTRELSEHAIELALVAANGKQASITKAINADIELIQAHAPQMDDTTLARAEKTINNLKLRRRYNEKQHRSKA